MTEKLLEQIKKAQAEMAKWTAQRIANCRLEGSK